MAQEPISLIVFSFKKVGKKHRRSINVARFFLGSLISAKSKPIFEARVSKDIILNVLEKLNMRFSSLGEDALEIYSDTDFRKIVVYTGVRQFMKNSTKARDWLEVVEAMGDLEVLFWYTKFLYSFERIGYWGVYRVAKSITTLYKL